MYIYKSLRGKELTTSFVKAVRTSGGVCGMIFTVSFLSASSCWSGCRR